mmetsp:Transcript_1423/g.4036  ORF Transcript_1423/g.4036 Transcript_1423/m.4036 type:complete len:217 (-) Transcript_1423:554-1204(-)
MAASRAAMRASDSTGVLVRRRHWKDAGEASSTPSPSAVPTEVTRMARSDTRAGGGMPGSKGELRTRRPTCSTRMTSRGGRLFSLASAAVTECATAPGTNSRAVGFGGGWCALMCSCPTPRSAHLLAAAVPSLLPSASPSAAAGASASLATAPPASPSVPAPGAASSTKSLARTRYTHTSSSSPVTCCTMGNLGADWMGTSPVVGSSSPSSSAAPSS